MLSTLRAWTETFHTRCTSVGNLGPTRFAKSQSSLGHTFPMFRTARKLFFSFSCWFYRIFLGGQTWPENRWFLQRTSEPSSSSNSSAGDLNRIKHNGMKHDTFCWKIIILYTHIYYKNQKWFTTHYYQISHMICNQQSRIYNGKPKLKGQEAAPTLPRSQDCQQTACAGDKSMVVGCISSVWWLVVVGRLDLWWSMISENLLSAGHSGFIMDELLRNVSHWTSRPQSICGKSTHPNVSASVDKIRKLSVESNMFSVHPPRSYIISNIIAILSQRNLCSHDIPYPPKNSRWWPYKSP